MEAEATPWGLGEGEGGGRLAFGKQGRKSSLSPGRGRRGMQMSKSGNLIGRRRALLSGQWGSRAGAATLAQDGRKQVTGRSGLLAHHFRAF